MHSTAEAPSWRARLRGLAAGVAIVAFFGLVGLFGCQVVSTAPGQAEVIVDPVTRTYISPPCFFDRAYDPPVSDARAKRFLSMTKDGAHAQKFKPDQTCANANGFTETQSMFSSLVLSREPTRWDAEGHWKW